MPAGVTSRWLGQRAKAGSTGLRDESLESGAGGLETADTVLTVPPYLFPEGLLLKIACF